MTTDLYSINQGVIGGILFILDHDHRSDKEKIEKIRQVMTQYVITKDRPLCSICKLPVLACDEFVNEDGLIHRACR